MKEETEKYICESCGSIIEIIMAGGGELQCCSQTMNLYFEDNYKMEMLDELEEHIEEIEGYIEDEVAGENIKEISEFIDELLKYIGTYSHNLENTPVYKKLVQLYEDLNYQKNIDEIIVLCRALIGCLKESVK